MENACLDGVFRAVHDARDVLVVQPVEIDQFERAALFGGEVAQGHVQQIVLLNHTLLVAFVSVERFELRCAARGDAEFAQRLQ